MKLVIAFFLINIITLTSLRLCQVSELVSLSNYKLLLTYYLAITKYHYGVHTALPIADVGGGFFLSFLDALLDYGSAVEVEDL